MRRIAPGLGGGVMRVGVRVVARAGEAGAQLRALPALALEAEAAGFDLLVVPERLSAQEGFPAALPACAAAAAATTRLRIASGLLALPLHHPLRVAEDAATVDLISGGRFELGVGLGAEPELFDGFGLDPRERAARFEEALALVRGAFQPGPLHFEGRHFRCVDLEVHPRPLQPGGPPLWLGARAPDALARVAQHGCGVVIEPQVDPAPYLDAWEASGRAWGDARVAFLVEAEGGLHQALASGDARLAGASIDLWLDLASGPDSLVRSSAHAAELRRRVSRILASDREET